MSFIEDLFKLNGKLAIVTGASRGIGLAIAQGLVGAGCEVWGFSRHTPDLKNKIKYFQVDITNKKRIEEFLEEKIKDKNINILVNSAGVSLNVHTKNSYENFSEIIKINLESTYQVCDLIVKKMPANSSIINVTSIGAHLGFPNNPGYQASKSGLSGMTRALAYDFSKLKVRVNNLVPGYIKTDMTVDSYNNIGLRTQRENRMLIQRWGEPEDLIGAAIFLASDASSYVTGIDLVVDGGWMIKGI